jgi:hypothetical protein
VIANLFWSRESGRQVSHDSNGPRNPRCSGGWSRGSGTGHRFKTRKSSRSLSIAMQCPSFGIHTWNVSAIADRRGHFASEREAIVVFEFAGIKSLRFRTLAGDLTPEQGLAESLGLAALTFVDS